MDQLDANLSGLRVALAERRRTVASDLTPRVPSIDEADGNNHGIVFKTSAGQSVSASIEPESTRSWFWRLFGV